MSKKIQFSRPDERVDAADRELDLELKFQKARPQNLTDCLLLLARMMKSHYGKSVILLIDEYDGYLLGKAGVYCSRSGSLSS